MTKPLWTLTEALPVIWRMAEPLKAAGAWVSLGGGALNKGQSFKDLDLIIAPLHYEVRRQGVVQALWDLGFHQAPRPEKDPETLEALLEKDLEVPYELTTPGREVWVYEYQGKRVDLFWFDWERNRSPDPYAPPPEPPSNSFGVFDPFDQFIRWPRR